MELKTEITISDINDNINIYAKYNIICINNINIIIFNQFITSSGLRKMNNY